MKAPRHHRAMQALSIALSLVLFGAGAASSANLYSPNAWSAMASDRPAERVGDSLTIIINEASTGSNTTQSGTAKTTSANAAISANNFNRSAGIGFGGSYTGSGQTARQTSMVAEISVVVTRVLPNGDLEVAGERLLTINGARENIKLRGRVRRADITGANTVLSTQLADAVIDYNGTGFVANGAKPGVVTRIFSWLGLM